MRASFDRHVTRLRDATTRTRQDLARAGGPQLEALVRGIAERLRREGSRPAPLPDPVAMRAIARAGLLMAHLGARLGAGLGAGLRTQLGKHRSRRSAKRIAVGIVAALLGAGIVAVGRPAMGPPFEIGSTKPIRLDPLAARSVVHAGDGSVLSVLHAGENRVLVPLEQLPDHLIDAVVDTEDANFFEHRGVNVRGIFRALAENLGSGSVEQGASTITQQLAKLEVGSDDRSLDSKVRETGIALSIERRLDKRQILERYLNAAYFGHGTYGVGAAAEYYFEKPVADIDAAEAALLAGLIANPEMFDPFEEPDAAKARRNLVLRRMEALGDLEPRAARTHTRAPLPEEAHPPAVDLVAGEEYFVQEVKRQLLADHRLGPTPEARYRRLFEGGVRVQTTIDPRLQSLAERAVREGLPDSPFTGALVAVDPASGEVRALVGGPGFERAKFNLATQGARQPGSAFKIATLAAALEAGISPEDVVDGRSPCEFPEHGDWRVENYGGASGGVMRVREALADSVNCAFARIVLAVGPEKVVDVAHRLGIERPLDPFPAITLGTEEVSPLEMGTLFATLAADGVRRGPLLVRKVQSADGEVLVDNTPEARQEVDPQVARWATDVMRGVIEGGTGTRADIGRPVAGKTGTSQQWRDAWFAGYTPQLATVVWMGSPEGEIPMEDVEGTNVTGGSFPAAIWAEFMRSALEGVATEDFVDPDPEFLSAPALVTVDGREPLPPPPKKESKKPDKEDGDGGGSGKRRRSDGDDD